MRNCELLTHLNMIPQDKKKKLEIADKLFQCD